MHDEQSERRTQILDAALHEFASKGFRGATIKSIAAAAKLQSPTLIYWYFPTKEALFEAVLARQAQFLTITFDPQEWLDKPPEVVLPHVAKLYLATIDQPTVRKLFRLVLGEVVRASPQVQFFNERWLPQIVEVLTSYMQHQITLGHLKSHDARASARAFMGMLLPQAVGKLLFPALQQDGLTDAEHIRTSVAIFLNGLSQGASDERD